MPCSREAVITQKDETHPEQSIGVPLFRQVRSPRLGVYRKQICEGRTHFGIFVARGRANDAAPASWLLALPNSVTAEEMVNQLRFI